MAMKIMLILRNTISDVRKVIQYNDVRTAFITRLLNFQPLCKKFVLKTIKEVHISETSNIQYSLIYYPFCYSHILNLNTITNVAMNENNFNRLTATERKIIP